MSQGGQPFGGTGGSRRPAADALSDAEAEHPQTQVAMLPAEAGLLMI